MQRLSFRTNTAWVVMLATVFVVLFSSFYIADHANHDCIGEDCPVCAVMEQCRIILKTIGTAVLVTCACIASHILLQSNTLYQAYFFICNSLFSQKVRMNN